MTDTHEDPEQEPTDRPVGAAAFSEAELDELRDEGQPGRGDPIPPATNGPADELGSESEAYSEAQVAEEDN